MLESIEKLREAGRYADESGHTLAHAMCIPLDLDGVTNLEVAHAFADAIQAEVDERYMELPLDADGVPIRVGDKMKLSKDRVGTVVAVSETQFTARVSSREEKPVCQANLAHHFKPHTVEDVLREFAYKVCDLNVADEAIAKYAVKIREAVSADE